MFSLIGLNESGKTTILEAIHSFSPDRATRELVGSPKDDIAYYETWVPRHEYSSFSGRITVTASASLEGDDIRAAIEYAETEYDLKIHKSSLPSDVTIHKWVEFHNGDYVANGIDIDGQFSVKTKAQKKWHQASAPQKEIVCEAIYNQMPDIAYFPTFIFDFPERIYLTNRGSAKDRFYRRTFQEYIRPRRQRLYYRERYHKTYPIRSTLHALESLLVTLVGK